MRSQVIASISSALVFGLSACAIQDPLTGQALREQSLPKVAIPSQFSTPSISGPALDRAWLAQFNDPELNELVAEALQNHPDIRVMAARRLQAQALIDAAGGA